MKITFISPYYSNCFEQLGIGYIASYCKRRNIQFKFFHEFFDSIKNIISESVDSDIVAFSCTTPTYQRGMYIAQQIKLRNKNVHTVMGGWHTTVTKEIPNDCIDQIVVGEGETAFLDIVNGNREPIIYGRMLDFDKLPWPNRTLINVKRQLDYCERRFGERIGSFVSRRGCPMSCTICAERHMSHNNIRIRNPLDLLDEIDFVNKTYNLSKFKFVDPTWNYPKSSVVDFCMEKIRRCNNLEWEAMVHAAYLDDDMLVLLKAANCNQINIGVESGSQIILNEINKGITPDKIRKIFKFGKHIGLDMRAFTIIGLPPETQETIEETRQLIRDVQPDVFGMTLLCPYPGTKYYQEKYKDVDWSEQGEYTNNIWSTDNFSNTELKEIIREFNTEFYDILVSHQKDNTCLT